MSELITAESTKAEEVESYWQKLFAILLHKLGNGKPVELTDADFEAYFSAFHPEPPVLMTEATDSNMRFSIVPLSEFQQRAGAQAPVNVPHH